MAPIAMAIPPSDMMFEVSPIIFMGMKAITTATGMVKTGTVALGACRRKTKITIATIAGLQTTWFADPYGTVFILMEKRDPQRPFACRDNQIVLVLRHSRGKG